MRLINDKVMPPWALFCFTDFKHAEPSIRTPSEVAIIGDGFVLLAPEPIEGGYTGLLLAEYAYSGQVCSGTYLDKEITIKLPEFQDYVLAKEGVELDEMQPPVPVLQSD
jgi:hypothetical protein